ncbi:DUF1015 family protein [Nocardioides donggukensis]|uniref:DUF1015 family protein n=1 Tax=Nocardioides donggukensis TaxID=2774019 RepID=A0A927K526_9ACTN|nr:DUF1015 family protein [Nocardioides donggukensis]MBD8869270.1 DUF1015 family protein [Nocardioides donggukensis]
MDTTSSREPQFALLPFRALRLSDSYVGAPVAHRVLTRPYRSVPSRTREWRRRRHLRLDPAPAIYLHEYTSAGVSVRGIVGTLALEDARGVVFPHEGVREAQVGQLAERMEQMRLNPAPILLMARAAGSVRHLVAQATAGAPDHVYTDRSGQVQRIWRVSEPDTIRALQDALAGTRAVIADGHHRYAAARRLDQARPGTDWARTLVMLVDQADTPLQLSAIHRSIPRLDLADVARAAAERGDAFTACPTRQAALDHLEDSLVLHDGSGWATLRPAPPDDRMLVHRLHDELLPAWGVDPEVIGFHHTAGEALDRAGPGLAVLLPAPSFDQVDRSARSGRLLPHKATSFQPKPHVGVLMRAVPDE